VRILETYDHRVSSHRDYHGSVVNDPNALTSVIEKADEISEGDIKTITLKGTDFGSMEVIKFEGDVLKIKVAPKASH